MSEHGWKKDISVWFKWTEWGNRLWRDGCLRQEESSGKDLALVCDGLTGKFLSVRRKDIRPRAPAKKGDDKPGGEAMTVHEIIRELRQGKEVNIPADYVTEFMRECERYGETVRYTVVTAGGVCTLRPDAGL